jgi:hypothetical protein
LTSPSATETFNPAWAVVADKTIAVIRKNLRIVASIDDGDSFSYPGTKLCDLGHPLLPGARYLSIRQVGSGTPTDRWPVGNAPKEPVGHRAREVWDR